MPKFVKITDPIEARQWSGLGEDLFGLLHWMKDGPRVTAALRQKKGDGLRSKEDPLGDAPPSWHLVLQIDTGLAGSVVEPGDWIIMDVKGVFRPIQAEAFREHYQPVPASEA